MKDRTSGDASGRRCDDEIVNNRNMVGAVYVFYVVSVNVISKWEDMACKDGEQDGNRKHKTQKYQFTIRLDRTEESS